MRKRLVIIMMALALTITSCGNISVNEKKSNTEEIDSTVDEGEMDATDKTIDNDELNTAQQTTEELTTEVETEIVEDYSNVCSDNCPIADMDEENLYIIRDGDIEVINLETFDIDKMGCISESEYMGWEYDEEGLGLDSYVVTGNGPIVDDLSVVGDYIYYQHEETLFWYMGNYSKPLICRINKNTKETEVLSQGYNPYIINGEIYYYKVKKKKVKDSEDEYLKKAAERENCKYYYDVTDKVYIMSLDGSNKRKASKKEKKKYVDAYDKYKYGYYYFSESSDPTEVLLENNGYKLCLLDINNILTYEETKLCGEKRETQKIAKKLNKKVEEIIGIKDWFKVYKWETSYGISYNIETNYEKYGKNNNGYHSVVYLVLPNESIKILQGVFGVN